MASQTLCHNFFLYKVVGQVTERHVATGIQKL